MANERSTADIHLKYAVETTAGTFPTSGYTEIPNVKSIPGFDATPAAIDATDLQDKTYKRYVPGLIDQGGDIAIDANLTSALKTAWNTLKTSADTAASSNKATWFEIKITGWTDSFYFAGMPSELGIGAMSVDNILEVQLHVAPNQVKGWATASTT